MIDNNVFNKVVNDILLQVKPIYLRKQIATEFLDLITRMQEEKPRPKKILANRVYADATLMSMTKAELIEHIRILEHNWSAAEETLANSVKNSEQIFYEQKEEIERLKDENCHDYHCMCLAQQEKAELQKQVNELKEENYQIARKIFGEMMGIWFALRQYCPVSEDIKFISNSNTLRACISEAAKKYGVEV